MNKNFLFLFLIFVLCFYTNTITGTALIISEIMYNPIGSDKDNEWVEIYNEESTSVTVSNYKLNEYNSNADPNTNDNHRITPTDILPSYEYAVIANDMAKFRSYYTNYTGKLYESSFILSNSIGQKISIRHKLSGASNYNILSEINTTNYLSILEGRTICNNKVEQTGEEWGECTATPGVANTYLNFVGNGSGTGNTSSSTATSTGNSNSSTTTATSTSSSTINTQGVLSVPMGINYYVPNTNLYIKVGDMNIDSIKEKNVIAGSEFNLVVRTFNNKNEAIKNLKYYWSTGDGGYYEGENLIYKYHLPGTYDYTIEAGDYNSYAVYRGVIKVYEPSIRISNAATNSNYIMIKNDMNIELDIGGYMIKDNVNNKNYKIARNTILKNDRELKLSGAAMGFVSTSSDSFSLLDIAGKTLSEYKRPTTNIATNTIRNLIATTTNNNFTKSLVVTKNENTFLSYNLAASASMPKVTNKNITSNFLNIKNYSISKNVEYRHSFIYKK